MRLTVYVSPYLQHMLINCKGKHQTQGMPTIENGGATAPQPFQFHLHGPTCDTRHQSPQPLRDARGRLDIQYESWGGHKLFVLRFTNKLNWRLFSLWRTLGQQSCSWRDIAVIRDITWTGDISDRKKRNVMLVAEWTLSIAMQGRLDHRRGVDDESNVGHTG